MKGLTERIGPGCAGLFLFIGVYFLVEPAKYLTWMIGSIDNVISIDSALLAYIGVLVGLLLALSDRPVMQRILAIRNGKLWKRYIQTAFCAGVVHLVLSLTIELFVETSISKLILSAWWGVLVYYLSAVYRISLLTLKAIFATAEKETHSETKMTPEEIERYDKNHTEVQ